MSYAEKFSLTQSEGRVLKSIEKRTSNEFRNFWIHVMKRHGLSNTEIAEEVGLVEGSVRAILNKK